LGIDDELFTMAPPAPDGPFLAVGRDLGRDWPTLLRALEMSGVPAQIVTRPRILAGLDVPATVDVVGRVDRTRYRALLAEARAVVITTQVLAYPSGQSVLLEAMARGRTCIVTDTPAMRDYVAPGGPALLVPPSDVDALAETLIAVERGRHDLGELGRRARLAVEERFTAARMWSTVATELHQLGNR
jgi:glycosyltransferase involved in cell wall biosynthesis